MGRHVTYLSASPRAAAQAAVEAAVATAATVAAVTPFYPLSPRGVHRRFHIFLNPPSDLIFPRCACLLRLAGRLRRPDLATSCRLHAAATEESPPPYCRPSPWRGTLQPPLRHQQYSVPYSVPCRTGASLHRKIEFYGSFPITCPSTATSYRQCYSQRRRPRPIHASAGPLAHLSPANREESVQRLLATASTMPDAKRTKPTEVGASPR